VAFSEAISKATAKKASVGPSVLFGATPTRAIPFEIRKRTQGGSERTIHNAACGTHEILR
jgi:hypothetical protein